jgi:6-phosphogluconolactonase
MVFSIEIVEPALYAAAVADEIITSAKESISQNASFSLGLSGGSTPGGIYRLLTITPRANQVEWEKVKFFVGDERYVPLNNTQSNYRMFKETLLNSVDVGKATCFYINTELGDVKKSVADYSDKLSKNLASVNNVPSLDLLLLGLGEDGHIASLFPKSPELENLNSLVVHTINPNDKSERISLGVTTIQAAKRVVFLVKGSSKSDILKKTFEAKATSAELPALLLKEQANKVTFYVDSAAAAKLPRSFYN